METKDILYYINLIVDILFCLYLCFNLGINILAICLSPLDHTSYREKSKAELKRNSLVYLFLVVISIIGFFLPESVMLYYKLIQKIIVSITLIVMALYWYRGYNDFNKKIIFFHFLYLSSLGFQIAWMIFAI